MEAWRAWRTELPTGVELQTRWSKGNGLGLETEPASSPCIMPTD